MMANESNRQAGVNSSQSPCLEPKHKIFLSHSGAQKNFMAQLCEDLTRVNHVPFFDKRLDSLPKGEEFPPLLFKAARQCWVAILVLSEEYFTRSKWPMVELNEFVQAKAGDNRGLKLLPLFFALKLEQLKDAGNQNRWRKAWEEWASKDDRIDVEKWVRALSKVLGPVNGMEYDGVDEVGFRKNVVEAVCKLIPADVTYDVSHVQARPQLCKAMRQKMDESCEIPGCGVVGLFGTGGMGKTTISKVMCNENFGEFGGKVCHIEFDGCNYVELRKRVLRELTGANLEHLPNDGDKLSGLLKSRMHEQKVFLSLDNVLFEHDIEEANKYLDIEYLQGSKVLVISRSLDVLKSLRRLSESDCMEMPELEEQDATNAFLYYAGCSDKSFNGIQLGIIKRCVEVCKFTKKDLCGSEIGSSARQYLPLALKVWGTQLGHISGNPLRWVESLKTLTEHKFNHFNKRDHPLFSLLRQGYDKLDEREQQIFLDLAIFFPQRSLLDCTDYSIVEWLSIIQGCSKYSIKRSLNALTRMALLEDSRKDGLEFKIHDLYVEFARVEAQAGPFDRRRILCKWKGSDIPRELVKRPGGGFWSKLDRLGLYGSEVRSLAKGRLDCCCNVEILQLYDCHQLMEADVGCMESLISLDVAGCKRLGEKFWGVEKLKNLAWLRWRDIDGEIAPFVLDLSSLRALQVLHLHCELWRHKSVVPPNLSGCVNLRELSMDGFCSLQSLPDLSKLSKLEKISFRYAHEVGSVVGLSSLTNLQVLSLYWCSEVSELPGLCDLIALETLDLTDVGVVEIRDLQKQEHLRNLTVSSCRHLTSLGGLEHLTSLQRLDASDSKNLRELPDCSKLKELEVVNLSYSGVCIIRRSDFGRLAKHRILKMEGCGGLLELLVVWLLVQRGQLPWAAVFERLWWERHSSGADQCPSNSKEDFAHYMNEAALVGLKNMYLTSANLNFCEEEILPSPRILGVVGGGVDNVITALCEDGDLGILSLLVAKYVGHNFYIQAVEPLCRSIIRFFKVLVQQMNANRKTCGRERDHLVSLVLFILEHVTKNDALATGLGIQKADKFSKENVVEAVCKLIPAPDVKYDVSAVWVRGGGGGMVMGTTRELNTMEQLLVQCATALEATDITYAQQAIFVVNNVAAVDGDPNQRLLAHFMRSLILRASKFAPQLLSGISEAHEVMMRIATTTTTLKTVLELTNYIDVMPWYRFGFIAANGAMLGAFEGKDKVHIVDFNVSHCMQWPTLIEALAERREGPPHVRLTVCVSKSPIPPLLDVPYADLVMRLAKFARSKSVPFEYALLDMEDLETEICIREGEALAVNCLFRLHYVSDEAPAETGSVTDQVARSMACPRDEVLAFIRSLNPAIVTLTEEDASLTSSKLVTRLRAAFNYLWIPFDALHTLSPGESQQRRHCEDEVASKIENLVACEGRYRIERVESKDKWVQRMRRARFEMVSFSEDVVAENKLMLGEHSSCWGLGSGVKDEDEDVLFLTWKGHNVSFSTAWGPCR